MSSKDDCASHIIGALSNEGISIDKGVARNIVDRVLTEYEAHGATGVTEDFVKHALKLMKREQLQASENRALAKLKIKKLNEIKGKFRTYKDKFGDKAAADYLTKTMLGGNRLFSGFGASVGSQQNQLMKHFRGMINNMDPEFRDVDIELIREITGRNPFKKVKEAVGKVTGKEGLAPDIVAKKENDIVKEMFELSSKSGKPGVTGDVQALRIAKQLRKVLEEGWQVSRDSGLNTGKLDGFTIPISHNARMLQDLGFETWKNKVKEMDLDLERMGISAGELDSFLKNMHRDITEGKLAFIDDPRSGAKITSDQLPKDGSSLTKSRQLHFKDANGIYAYNKEFGAGNVLSSVLNRVDYIAKVAPMVKAFGTDIRSNIEDLTRQINKEFAESGSKVRVNEKRVQDALNTILPDPAIKTNDRLRTIGTTLRGLSRLSLLGKVALYTPLDLATMVSSLKATTGVGYGEAVGTTFRALKESFKPSEQRRMMKEFGYFTEDLIGELSNSRLMGDIEDQVPGTMAYLTRNFFKINMAEYFTSAMRSATMNSVSRLMADTAGKSWDGLSSRMRANLDRFGLDAKSWDVMRQGVATDPRGAKYLTPEKIIEVGGNSKIVREAANSLRLILIEHAEEVSPEAGAKERFMFYRGSKAGTIGGELARTTMMFKPTVMKMLNTTMRFMMSDPDKPLNVLDAFDFEKMKSGQFKGAIDFDKFKQMGDMQLTAVQIGMLTGMGSMLVLAQQASRDENFDIAEVDPQQLFLEGLARGGSLGLLGDFVSGEAFKYGGALDYAAGPVVTSLAGAIDAANSDRGGASSFVNSVKRFTPGSNLPLVGQAMDSLIFDTMGNMIDSNFSKKRDKARLKAQRRRKKQ